MGGLLQVCWHETPQNPNYSQQAPANWPLNYPDWVCINFTHPHAWRPIPNAPEAPRNQRPPQGRNQNSHTHRFGPKSRRYNPTYPLGWLGGSNTSRCSDTRVEYRDYVNHSYRSHRPEPHRPQAPRNPENSGLGRMNEKRKQTRPFPYRRLERLSYERPSNVSQTGQTSNEARDSSTIQSGAAPIISNFQRFELPRPPFPEKRPGSRFESRAHADPPSPSLESVSNELSANWEDGYEQDDPEMPRGHIFKDSTKTKTQQQLSPQRPSALPTFDDPMLNPWINN
ncbi:hypothetical protein BDZ94DRAFT_1243849 [Collybia nuda]|uniref:Uncharacterized protein n=1 Tax=Collybia nuda TaxID=64659 RepID=A0A9P5YJW1_9AGAR|nr:hypothetical protein BDZ94DRAFT_1243849 [Collybia nuda]